MAVSGTNADYSGKASTKNGPTWIELLAPAPMGIAVMSQLLICSSRVRDFEINNSSHKLMKHPDSFRTTLVQIANESYEAFMKAHDNMEKIQMKMERVPDYIEDCIKYLKSENKVIKEKLLPKRIERIRETAESGQKLSEEVNEAFLQLGKLIREVIEASTKTMGDQENQKRATIEEKKKNEEELKKKEQEKLQKEIDDAKKNVKEKQQHLDETRKIKWRETFLIHFGYESKGESLKYAQMMRQEAENQLMQTKREAEAREKEIDKTCEENIKKLEEMSVDFNNEMVSQNEIIKILQKGLDHLAELQKEWYGITTYFGTIKNQLGEQTSQNLIDFIDKIEVVREESTAYDEIMPSTEVAALESSKKTHHTVKMYVKVSNNYIMKNINQMHGMLALPSNMVQEREKQIQTSCTEASNGIMEMYREEMNNKVLEIKERLANM